MPALGETGSMHSHKSHREHVADAILGIKSLASHEERLEAYLLLNAEVSARTLDAMESVLDEIETFNEHAATATTPADP